MGEEKKKEFLSLYCPVCGKRFDVPMPEMIRKKDSEKIPLGTGVKVTPLE